METNTPHKGRRAKLITWPVTGRFTIKDVLVVNPDVSRVSAQVKLNGAVLGGQLFKVDKVGNRGRKMIVYSTAK